MAGGMRTKISALEVQIAELNVDAAPQKAQLEALQKEKDEAQRALRAAEANMAFVSHEAESAKKEAQTMPVIMQSLRDEVAAARGPFAKASIIQGRLRVGWGTLRVASGMAIGAHFYDMFKGSMDDSSFG